MERWKGKVAVVTGASSGIGEAIAKELVESGMVVVGLSINVDSSEKLPIEVSTSRESGKLYCLKTDISREEDVVAAFDWVERELGGGDVLVNNAGIFKLTDVEDGSYADWKAIFDVNVLGTSTCTREFLKSLKKHGKEDAHIFNINSVTGKLICPHSQFYFASKHALLALSQGIRKSLAERKSRIKVTDICSGYVKTGLLNEIGMQHLFEIQASMMPKDIALALVGALSASPVTQICEIVVTAVPTEDCIY